MTVMISPQSTARENEDFIGSRSIHTFQPGERTSSVPLIINSDNIPERDETIIVKLINPTGGASVAQGTGNNVTVVIQANDVVAGYVGFSLLSQAVIVREGEVVRLQVVRTPPAAGVVSVAWIIQGRNVTNDFNETFGTVVFREVWYGFAQQYFEVRHGTLQCSAVLCSAVQYSALQGSVVWCGVVWCGVVWCGVVWCGVVWCGVGWGGVVWCGVVWCGVVWCGVVWCGVVWCGVVWCGVVWCGVVWCGVVWCGVVWGGVVWCGVVWGGVVWCGVVWCGVVWCGVVWCGVV